MGKEVVICTLGWNQPHVVDGSPGNVDLRHAWLGGENDALLAAVEQALPPGMKAHVVVDATPFSDPWHDKDSTNTGSATKTCETMTPFADPFHDKGSINTGSATNK